MLPPKAQSGSVPDRQWFATTHWSVVRNAADSLSAESDHALESLCRSYWYPLYAYVRRRGYDAEISRDLTQEFFAQLLAKRLLHAVDPTKGRFRSWLLGVMKHFLAHEWTKTRAQKRGGGQLVFSLDELEAENRYQIEPTEEIHRLRQRYQELIREEIAQTVATASEVDEEIRYLLTVIRG